MNYKSNICEKERISHSWTDAILLPISCKLNSINFLSDNHQANLTEEAGIKPATKFFLENQLWKNELHAKSCQLQEKKWRAQEVHMMKARRPFLCWNWHEVRFHKLVSKEILTLKKKELARRQSWLCINSISFPSTTTALFHCCKLYYQAFVVSTAIAVTKAVAYLDWGRSRGPAGTALHYVRCWSSRI